MFKLFNTNKMLSPPAPPPLKRQSYSGERKPKAGTPKKDK